MSDGIVAWRFITMPNSLAIWTKSTHQHSHLHVVQHFFTSAYPLCTFGLTNVHHWLHEPHRIDFIGASSGRACHATPPYRGESFFEGATFAGRPIVRPQLQRKVFTIAIIHHPNILHICHSCVEDCTYSCLLHVLYPFQGRREQPHVPEPWHVCVVFAAPIPKNCRFFQQLWQSVHQALSFSVSSA